MPAKMHNYLPGDLMMTPAQDALDCSFCKTRRHLRIAPISHILTFISCPETPLSMELKRSPIDQEAAHILYPPTKDEGIVNSTLLDFANALLAHHPLQNKWSLHPVPLTATFKKASFQARTDGYLQDRKTGKIRALVEVKPYMRDTSLA
ncbi:hypothetical protein AARAC_000462 [Aspergillus arachidicola]|uniref:Uncharacterized protein n=1 Tax=Aspergillus arachidicola TaxID=656916 RepID=A0A2G7G764_9EURO|nr:hypothetical protein AARAC_000462 [Aspergillus arachidicola]